MPMNRTKIVTKKGKVITLTISHETDSHIEGTDKFGDPVKLRKDQIDERLPYA